MKHLSMNDCLLISNALLHYIKVLKEQLIRIGISEGLSSENTLRISEELDKYIYLYQRFTQTKPDIAS